MIRTIAAISAAAMLGGVAAAKAADTQRGAYLAAIMDCGGCHTGGALAGQPDPALNLAGSDIGFSIPGLGYFYPPNLTPDRETGTGDWSASDLVRAIRTGERPDGRILAPAMPWHSYAALTDDDVLALVAYLQSLPAVSHAVPPPTGPDEDPSAPYMSVVMPD